MTLPSLRPGLPVLAVPPPGIALLPGPT
uniref:Uncharacterized protein n=1 Tax=Arundo donax TaxID=35708 RepID=A0A0A8YX97_ARUDO